MELYESIRLRQDDFINQNPASIVISRTTRTLGDDGGYTEATSNLASQDVRIYNKRTRVLNITDGGWHSQRITKMIAKYDADIKKEGETETIIIDDSPLVEENVVYLDTFTNNGTKYKVKDVKPIMTQGYVCFLECELEEIT